MTTIELIKEIISDRTILGLVCLIIACLPILCKLIRMDRDANAACIAAELENHLIDKK